ncbi:ABC transporter substrate-binding protein [Vreelandella titanicae]|uniref:heme/hemin ABC transporter substrate-binding protein n=1 Tax=Vreelandella titanicae TaxID=664683 RepID=UPI002420024E|nr:ABC transporter substrate-binding protein [Halomonas titanicae]
MKPLNFSYRLGIFSLMALLVSTPLNALANASIERIVVTDPGHVEIIDALGMGNALILVPEDPSMEGNYPQAERFHRAPSIESILEVDPQLVLAGNPGRALPVLDQVVRLGIPQHMIDRSLPPTERIRRIAELIGRQAQGEALIAHIEQTYQQVEAIPQQQAPRILHISSSGGGSSGAVTGAGAGTSAHALIERAGGINVGAEAGLERYQTLSAEGVMSMAPDAVVISDLEVEQLGGADGIWEHIPGLNHTPAAVNNRLIIMDHAAIKFDAASSGAATLSLAEALHTP